MFHAASESRSHQSTDVTSAFFHAMPPGRTIWPSMVSPETGFRMWELATSPTPSTENLLSYPLNRQPIFAAFVESVRDHVFGKILNTPLPIFPFWGSSSAFFWAAYLLGSMTCLPTPSPLGMALCR